MKTRETNYFENSEIDTNMSHNDHGKTRANFHPDQVEPTFSPNPTLGQQVLDTVNTGVVSDNIFHRALIGNWNFNVFASIFASYFRSSWFRRPWPGRRPTTNRGYEPILPVEPSSWYCG